MDLSEGKEKFINAWGLMGVNWGVNKTMGQIHALLLINLEPVCADDIMELLDISRGSVHQNLKCLVEWELIRKVSIEGKRKEHFEAEKDIWTAFTKIIKERKKKELEPIIKLTEELKPMQCKCPESSEFCKVIEELNLFSVKADNALENIIGSKSSWLIGNYLKMMR